MLNIKQPFPENCPRTQMKEFDSFSTNDTKQFLTSYQSPGTSRENSGRFSTPRLANTSVSTSPLFKASLRKNNPISKSKFSLLQELKIKTVKNYAKLKRNKEKRSNWMEQVAGWRRNNITNPNYHANHPEECKFRRLRDRFDKKIEHLSANHEYYAAKIHRVERKEFPFNLTVT